MINNNNKINITLTIAIIIGFTCTQQMDASQRRKTTHSKELSAPTQASSPYDQAHIAQLQYSINKQTGQWYQKVICTNPCNDSPCTRDDCTEQMAMGSSMTPVILGTIAATITGNPIYALGTAATLLCFAGCQCLWDTEDDTRDNAQKLGKWYNAPLVEWCDGYACDRTDLDTTLDIGYTVLPICLGGAKCIAFNSPGSLAMGTAATILCALGCNHCNNPRKIARKEKDELARMRYLHTH